MNKKLEVMMKTKFDPFWVLKAMAVVPALLFVQVGFMAETTITFERLDEPLAHAKSPSYNCLDVSADGSVVVGWRGKRDPEPYAFDEAVLWENGTATVLGLLRDDHTTSRAEAVSADGSIVAGRSHLESDGEAFLWEDGTMTGLSGLPAGVVNSGAADLSADGSVVVGWYSYVSDHWLSSEAFRWENGTMTSLGDLPGGESHSQATGVSADGSVVVGFGTSESGKRAFRWENGTMTDLGVLAGASESRAYAVSADGAVVVGNCDSDAGYRAFRWKNGTMTALGGISGDIGTNAFAVSGDGSAVLGYSYWVGPVLWREENGWEPVLLADLLDEAGIDLDEYSLGAAWAMSSDGTTIAGFMGTAMMGSYQPFRMQITYPTLDPLIGGTSIAGQEDWYRSDWLGDYSTAFAPWLFHAEHGFLYRDPASTNESMYVYDDAMGAWYWTSETVYPFIYAYDPPADSAGTDIDSAWLYYFEDSRTPRVFGIVDGAHAGTALFFGP